MKRTIALLLVFCLFPVYASADDSFDRRVFAPFFRTMHYVLTQFGGYMILKNGNMSGIPLPYPSPEYPNIINTDYTLEKEGDYTNGSVLISYNPIPGVYMKLFEEYSDGETHGFIMAMESDKESGNESINYETEELIPPYLNRSEYAKMLMMFYIYFEIRDSYGYYDDNPILQMQQGIDIYTPISLVNFLDDINDLDDIYEEPITCNQGKFSQYITIYIMVRTTSDPESYSVLLPEGIDRCYFMEYY